MRRGYAQSFRVLWGVVVLLSSAAHLAYAQPPTERRSTQHAPMDVAREHMERGQSLYHAGRFIEAAEEFLHAYEAQPFAAFLYNAGVAYEKIDDPGRAAEYFQRYLTADPQAEDASEVAQRVARLSALARAREQQALAHDAAQSANQAQDANAIQKAQTELARAQAELETARERLFELETELAKTRGTAGQFKSLLSVQTKPVDATILLKSEDGKLLTKAVGSPFTHTLDEGRYVVQVDHPKYKSISTPISVAPGKVYVVITEMSQGQFLGFLRVVSSVPGAKVYLDHKEEGAVGRTPFLTALPTGKHRVWVERPGYNAEEQEVEVGVGDTTEVKVELTRVDYGRLRVVANRGDAEVFIDGVSVGRVPVEPEVQGGTHEVRVRAPDMKDWSENVVVNNGQVTPVRVRLRPAASRAGAWVTAGVAAALLGSGIVCSVFGKRLEDDLKAARDAGVLASDDERALRGKVLYIAADVSYALTIGLAGLATYYFLRDPLPDSEGRALEPRDWTFNPYATPDRVGAHVRARF